MLNPNHLYYSEVQVRELQRQAENRRLVAAAKRANVPVRPVAQRLLAAVGQKMVDSGRYLMSRGDTRSETPDWEYVDWAAS